MRARVVCVLEKNVPHEEISSVSPLSASLMLSIPAALSLFFLPHSHFVSVCSKIFWVGVGIFSRLFIATPQ